MPDRPNFIRPSWSTRASEALGFHKEHGRWPASSATDPAERLLYQWAKRTREARAQALLNEEQIAMLDAAGFPWDGREATWLEQVNAFMVFRDSAQRYPAESAPNEEERILARWVARQRRHRLDGTLSESRLKRLQEIDFQWGNDHRWEERFAACVEFQRNNGRWPTFSATATLEEHGLAHWAKWQRDSFKAGRLDAQRIRRLEAAGFSWTGRLESDPLDPDWLEQLARLEAFVTPHGYLPSLRSSDAKERELSRWVSRQREQHSQGQLAAQRIERLEALGLPLRPREDGWAAMWEAVLDFKHTEGSWPTNAPSASPDQLRLGRWMNQQRMLARRGKLDAERLATLNAAGFVWKPPVGRPRKHVAVTPSRAASAQAIRQKAQAATHSNASKPQSWDPRKLH